MRSQNLTAVRGTRLVGVGFCHGFGAFNEDPPKIEVYRRVYCRVKAEGNYEGCEFSGGTHYLLFIHVNSPIFVNTWSFLCFAKEITSRPLNISIALPKGATRTACRWAERKAFVEEKTDLLLQVVVAILYGKIGKVFMGSVCFSFFFDGGSRGGLGVGIIEDESIGRFWEGHRTEYGIPA